MKNKSLAPTIMSFCILFFLSPPVGANDFEITSFSRNGEISWDDTNTNGIYRIEWASTLTGEWHSTWSDQSSIWATGGVLSAKVPMFYRVVHWPRQTNEMMLVAGGGQPQGPSYDFYMAKYEVRNEEFAEFLNNAQANTNNPRGANMYFADSGDVYMDNSQQGDESLFDISYSRLLYNINNAVGSRYTVYNDYIGHPIVGMSWYGALKYCNWLTINSGRGEAQQCHSEGMHRTNWHPANLTYEQWADDFDDLERLEWIQDYSGFRLPMDDYTEAANYYNEFYKAAAWNGASNSVYAFGRNSIDGQDANYGASGDPFEAFAIETTPVGYYNGTDHGATFQTRANANFYGIYDLSGNVKEWMSDHDLPGSENRQPRGGGWRSVSSTCETSVRGATMGAAWSDDNTGFRVVTTHP